MRFESGIANLSPENKDNATKKLLDQARDVLRTRHYPMRTEQSYTDWIKRFILFHNQRYPKDLGSDGIQAFLQNLAVERKESASTQNRALSAILERYQGTDSWHSRPSAFTHIVSIHSSEQSFTPVRRFDAIGRCFFAVGEKACCSSGASP